MHARYGRIFYRLSVHLCGRFRTLKNSQTFAIMAPKRRARRSARKGRKAARKGKKSTKRRSKRKARKGKKATKKKSRRRRKKKAASAAQ